MSTPAVLYNNNVVEPAFGKAGVIDRLLTSNLVVSAGTLLVPETNASANAVQSLVITGAATAGAFVLNFNGQLTAPIAYNATAAQVQAALAALPNVGIGNIGCVNGPLPGTAVVITFAGNLGNLPQPLLQVASSTLNVGTAGVTLVTAGVGYGRYKVYAGAGVPMIAKYDYVTTETGTIIFGAAQTAQYAGRPMAELIYSGVFKRGNLIGLDANALTATGGRFLDGSLADNNSLVLIPGVSF